MNSPLTSPASSPSSSSSSLSVFVDPSGSVPLHLCRSHLLVRPSSHLAQRAAGTCEVPVDALLHATGFNCGGGGGGGGVFAGSCFGGQVIAAPMQNDVSAFYAPPYADGAFFDGWHHSFASAAAAAAVGINGMSGGWTTFDPRPIAAAAAGYACGPVGYGVDVRRKNATRESTSTLKAWLFDHIKNPYPTKGEKIMLAIITKMTLTQVSTWFANARRRLKKENKMQWSPRQRPNDDDDDEDDEDDDRNSLSDENDDVTGRAAKGDVTTEEDGEARAAADDDDDDVIVDTDCEGTENQSSPTNPSPNHHDGSTKAFEFPGVETTPLLSRSEPNSLSPKPDRVTTGCSSSAANVPLPVQNPPLSPAEGAGVVRQGMPLPASLYVGDDGGVKVKPRIWSLVDTATSGHVSPVDTATSGQELHRPEAAGRSSEAAFPVGRGWEGVGERAFQSWMSTVFHHPPVVDPLRHSSSSSSAFPRSLYVARPEIRTGSDDHVCGGALESPHYYWSPSALTFRALNGRLDLRELELGRKRHLNAATADQSVDVYSG